MDGYVSIYKDKFGKNWIVDSSGGSREHPGRWGQREGFTTWSNALASAQSITDSWRLMYPRQAVRMKISAAKRAHAKATQARADRLHIAA